METDATFVHDVRARRQTEGTKERERERRKKKNKEGTIVTKGVDIVAHNEEFVETLNVTASRGCMEQHAPG
jgi:hypothetical protein